MDRIVRVDVHLADLAEIGAMNEVYRRYFEAGKYPARTCAGSAKIVGGCRVEITCMARL
jgi:2-iminobutanoate/2-iminopropanoate deaminase